MQTPEDLGESQPIFDDVPYVGMIGIANSFIAFNNEELTGFQLLYGWIGPATLAEQAQTAAHQLVGVKRPQGWSNQLDTEPLINFYIARKKKFFSNESMDFAWALDV